MDEQEILSHDTEATEIGEGKKPYLAPELKVHGSVEKLTANFGLKGSDGIGGHSG